MPPMSRRHANTIFLLAAFGASPRLKAADLPWIATAGPALAVDLGGDELNSFMPSADGRQIVIDTETALVVVDSTRGTALRPALKAHREPAALAQALADGLRLVLGTWDSAKHAGRLMVVDVSTRKQQALATLSREPRLLAASANGQRFAVTDVEEKLQVFDASGRSLLGPIKPVLGQVVAGTRLDRITALALSPDGSRLAVAGEDVQTRIFDVASGKPVLTLDKGPFEGRSWVRGPSQQMVFTPDGARLIAFEQGGNLSIYDAASGRPMGDPVQVRSRVGAMAMGAGGSLWTATADGQLQRWLPAAR
jgi:WD40 repeat protein